MRALSNFSDMSIEEINKSFEDMADPSAKINSLSKKISQTLYISAFLLALTALNTFLFSLFPFSGLNSTWLLSMTTAVLSAAPSLLASFLLILCAAGLDSRNQTLTNRIKFISKAAWWMSLILILMIPVQVFSGNKALHAQSQAIFGQVAELRNIIKGIKATGNEQQLRAFMGSLPNPPRLPEKFDAPFPVIQQRAIGNLEATINRAINDAETQKNKNIQTLIREYARNIIQSLLLSAAFSMIAALNSRKNAISKLTTNLFRM